MGTKKAYIIHGWGGSPQGAWRPWLKKELELHGFDVRVPAMPDTDNPTIKKWISFLRKLIKNPDKNTILIGHSLGCAAILRFLDSLPGKVVVGKIVLIAPVAPIGTACHPGIIRKLSDDEKKILLPWIEAPIDAEKIKHSAKKIVAFFSDNDQWIPLESEKVIKENFGARTIIEKGMGHYSNDTGIKKIPAILAEILSNGDGTNAADLSRKSP
jgi:predicted alpha/beta hydrolase family esterase